MTRETTAQAIEPVTAVPSAVGSVLRGVVMGREARALARPRTGIAAVPAARAPDRPAPGGAQVSKVVSQADEQQQRRSPAAADDPASVDYQERGRGFRAGYEEGRNQGHAEGLQLGSEQGRAEGGQDGFKQGRLAGEEAGLKEHAAARQALADRLRCLDDLLKAMPAEIDRRLEQAEEDMLGLCFEAVVRIMGEAAASKDGVRAIVRQALVEAKCKEAATVRVNPRDLALLQADQELGAWLGSSQRVQWLADDRVAMGGCLVATPEGGLDARLETQLARLGALLAGARGEARQ